MTLDPESSVSETGFGEENEMEPIHSRAAHMITSPQSLSEYRQVFDGFDRQGHPNAPLPATGSESESEVRFSAPCISGAVPRKRTDPKVSTMSAYSSGADVEPTMDSGQLLPHDDPYSIANECSTLPTITHCGAQTKIGSSQSVQGITMFPEQMITSSESVDVEANARVGDHSGDKHAGVRRHLQVNIPVSTRSLNPPLNPPGVSPTDVMLKQDTSWVDKLLDSPIEAAQNFGGRRVYKFQ
jgi:hypothetical protein